MPRGLGKIQQVAKENAAKRKAYEEAGPGLRFLKLDDGDSVRVRFLEQGDDVWMLWTHQLPKRPGQKFGDSVWCLDQEDEGVACPGCNRQKTRSAKMCINVIWYDAPKIKRDSDGKAVKVNDEIVFEGTENCVATWQRGSTEGGRLAYLNEQHGGLVGHIFKITRQGSTKDDTKYFIDPDQLNVDPTPADTELYKAKPDPRDVVRKFSFGDMERAYAGGGDGGAPQAGLGQPQPDADMSGNVFANAAGGAIKRGAFGE